MNELDLSILKYYKEGKELCGFEPKSLWKNLVEKGYLDYDLELTSKGHEFIKTYPNWDAVTVFNNKTILSIHPKI